MNTMTVDLDRVPVDVYFSANLGERVRDDESCNNEMRGVECVMDIEDYDAMFGVEPGDLAEKPKGFISSFYPLGKTFNRSHLHNK
jgi:hypothetical protein